MLRRSSGLAVGGRGSGCGRSTGKHLVVQLAETHQHMLILEEIVGVGLGVGVGAAAILTPAHLASIVIIPRKYLVEGGVHYEGFVLQLLRLLNASTPTQGAEQILAIVLESGLRQLFRRPALSRLPEVGGQGLGAAAIGQ